MKNVILILTLVAAAFVSLGAQADWSSVQASWKGAFSKDTTVAPSATGALVGGAPQVSSANMEGCDDTTLKNESDHFLKDQQQQLENTLTPPKEPSCFDKYKNIKLGTSMGIPDLSGMLAALMQQICNAADTRFNAAVAPLNTHQSAGPFNVGTGVQTGAPGGSSGSPVSIGAPTTSTYVPPVQQIIH